MKRTAHGIELDLKDAVAACGALAWCMQAEEASDEGLTDISIKVAVTLMNETIATIEATSIFPNRYELLASMRDTVGTVVGILRKRQYSMSSLKVVD